MTDTVIVNDKEYRQIGSVLKPHGVRGEFVVFLESDFPEWVSERETLFALVNGKLETWNVIGSRLRNNKLVMAVKEYPSRTEIEPMAHTALFVPESEARQVINNDPDFFYNSDLVGLSVTHALSDLAFGTVKAVVEMPAHNLLEVERADGGTFLFPFTKALVKDIDLVGRRIQVLMPEGMMDMNDDSQEDSQKGKRSRENSSES